MNFFSTANPTTWVPRLSVLVLVAGSMSIATMEPPRICPADDGQATIGYGQAYSRLYRRMPQPEDQQLGRALPDLASPDLKTRIETADRLLESRAQTATQLLATLKELDKPPSRKGLGSFHVAVVLAGRLRIENAVPLLVPYLDYELDPETLPLGAFGPMHFPVAEALVDIGGREVVDAVLRDLSGKIPQQRLILAAWILQELLGREAARAVVENAAESAAAKNRANLDKAGQLLALRTIDVRGWTSELLRQRYRSLFEGKEQL